MAFLYILESETTGRFYIGSTNDLERRLAEHARGCSLATRDRGPWRNPPLSFPCFAALCSQLPAASGARRFPRIESRVLLREVRMSS